jgi:hypothetical protein
MSVDKIDSTVAYRLELGSPAEVDPNTGTVILTTENLLESGVPASFTDLTVTGDLVAGDATFSGVVEVGDGILVNGGTTISTSGIVAKGVTELTTDVYATNAAAITGGLTPGQVYRTALGVLMVVYTP